MKRFVASALAALLTVTSLGAHAQSGGAGADLRRILNELRTAKTQIEFDEAHHAIPSVLGRVGLSAEEKQDICAALEELSVNELYLIETDLNHPFHRTNVESCFENLNHRIERDRSFKNAANQAAPQMRIPKMRFKIVDLQDKPDYYIFGDLAHKEVTLTFDDGPSSKTTPEILNILDQAGIKAIFFNTGYNATAFPSQTKEVLARGHRLGSHTYFHSLDMGCKLKKGRMSQNYVLNEVTKGYSAVLNAGGQIDPFFRWPNGSSTKATRTNVMEMGLSVWNWSVDTEDWNVHNDVNGVPRSLVILDNLKKGLHHPQIPQEKWERGIVLFHDIWQQTVETLPLALNYLNDNGYTIVLPVNKNRTALETKTNVPSFFQPVLDMVRKNYQGTLDIFAILPDLTKDPEAKADLDTTWSEPSDVCSSTVTSIKIDAAGARSNGGDIVLSGTDGKPSLGLTFATAKAKTRIEKVKSGFKISIRGNSKWNDELSQCQQLARKQGHVSIAIATNAGLDDMNLLAEGAQTVILPADAIQSLICK